MATKDTRYSNIREFTDNSTHAHIKTVRDGTVQGSGKQKRRLNKRLYGIIVKKKKKMKKKVLYHLWTKSSNCSSCSLLLLLLLTADISSSSAQDKEKGKERKRRGEVKTNVYQISFECPSNH